jgi:hypothetical protein
MSVDREETFAHCMARLGIAFSKTLSKPQVDLYWENLSDIPSEVLAAATDKWLKEQATFPRIAQLREFCDRVPKQALALRAQLHPAPYEGEPTYHCPDCEDRGHESYLKWVPIYQAEVWYAKRCHCWNTNPKLLAEREANRRFAARDEESRFSRRRN